jgi:hypothetical protein
VGEAAAKSLKKEAPPERGELGIKEPLTGHSARYRNCLSRASAAHRRVGGAVYRAAQNALRRTSGARDLTVILNCGGTLSAPHSRSPRQRLNNRATCVACP